MANARIPAAGGLLWTVRAAERHYALVHRPRYDDWSLPKGKLHAGEHPMLGARREVEEETGFTAALGRRLRTNTYDVPGGVKTVEYWAMRAVGGRFRPGDEVDDLRWLDGPAASRLLSYDRDRAVLADFADAPVGEATVLLVRHANAGDRKSWAGDDRLRPLDETGRRQAERLRQILPLWRPDRVICADRTRCVETVAPLAADLGVEIGLEPVFTEESVADDPAPALATLKDIAARAGASVVCSQGGAIPALVAALGYDGEIKAKKGSVWALEFAADRLVAADYYPRFR